MKKGLLKIFSEDNVAVALEDLKTGECFCVGDQELTLLNDIPFGHKAALKQFQPGDMVIKYGQPIGHAACVIQAGEYIHVHNLKTNLEGVLDYQYTPDTRLLQNWDLQKAHSKEACFQGYVRPDGTVGIRNEVWIIPTVGCVNTTAQLLCEKARAAFGDKVDGICAFPHNMGCSQLSDDLKRTQLLLKGLIENPNAGAVLVLSLGCENNHLGVFKPLLGNFDTRRVKFLVTQDVEDEYQAGMELLKELVDYAASMKRSKVPASRLTIGFKCGGSDAFSGITANALCGHITQRLTACGGSAILTEVPEMFGAETLLMKRAVSEDVFQDIVSLINNYKNYFVRYGQEIYENPSPGNKKGGISTLEEKSLGCTQKGGNAPVVGVLDYGEKIKNPGLNLLTGSGNDQISCTNLVASGAVLLVFTTGRGNPFGSPVPTVKLSSNTPLAQKKPHWIDYNAGRLLEGETFEDTTEDFFQYLLDVASGIEKTHNESNGYKEISIFRDGVIL